MSATLEADGTNIRLDGGYYQEVMRQAHERLQPRTYFEIGSLFGDTLRLASCAAVAVDPARNLKPDVLPANPKARFFEETSDDFFAAQNLTTLFGRPVDFAFLDGMHEFPFLLRDFINTEKQCRPGSIILLHDCLPGDAHMTRLHSEIAEEAPTNFPQWWTGDVWKLTPILRRHRPDLKVLCLDSAPTGLVAVTNLDPANRVLEQAYPALIAEWAPIRLQDWGMERLLQAADPIAAEAWLETLRPFGLTARLSFEADRLRSRMGATWRGARGALAARLSRGGKAHQLQ